MNKKEFSIITCFRNRETIRIKRFLESIKNQRCQNFELLFVNYGSDEKYNSEVKELVESYSFATYIFTETSGWFWNQPHALNIGVRRAKGDYIVRIDNDMILHPDTTQFLAENCSANKLFHAHCYLLPEQFNQYDQLFQTAIDHSSFQVSGDSQLGIFLAVHKEKLEAIGGFDEFFTFWGADDIDINRRLVFSGIEHQWLPLSNIPMYHQWHVPSGIRNPKEWVPVMLEYIEKNAQNPTRNKGKIWGKNITLTDRLVYATNNTVFQPFSFSKPLESSYNRFCNLFYSLESGAGVEVQQTFKNSFSSKPSTLKKRLDSINQLLNKTRFSYRLASLDVVNYEKENAIELFNWLFYFITYHHHFIADYSLKYDDYSIYLRIVKQ